MDAERVLSECRVLEAQRNARLLVREFNAKLRTYGITSSQFVTLAYLMNSGVVMQGQLCDDLCITRSTMTRNMTRLVTMGLVSREFASGRHHKDHELTELGRRKFEETYPVWEVHQASLANPGRGQQIHSMFCDANEIVD